MRVLARQLLLGKRRGVIGNSDCSSGTFCAVGIGEKYGLPRGSNVCIPTYHYNQIKVLVGKILTGVQTPLGFVERGTATLPARASVKILRGQRIGCMGAWDGTGRRCGIKDACEAKRALGAFER